MELVVSSLLPCVKRFGGSDLRCACAFETDGGHHIYLRRKMRFPPSVKFPFSMIYEVFRGVKVIS